MRRRGPANELAQSYVRNVPCAKEEVILVKELLRLCVPQGLSFVLVFYVKEEVFLVKEPLRLRELQGPPARGAVQPNVPKVIVVKALYGKELTIIRHRQPVPGNSAPRYRRSRARNAGPREA